MSPDMPEAPPQALLLVVREQAEARVRMDVSGVARYLTPDAVESLRASFPGLPPRVSAYEIIAREARRGDFDFDIRYTARAESFVVRSRWRELPEGWRVVHAERLWAEGQKRPGVVSRLLASVLRAVRR